MVEDSVIKKAWRLPVDGRRDSKIKKAWKLPVDGRRQCYKEGMKTAGGW